jgi:arginine decarboxylase
VIAKLLPTPKKFTLVAGKGEGLTRLTAFDKALLDAGIGNLNLLKVSSILPPDCEYVEKLAIPPGSLTPTAYGALISDVPGEVISAAIGVGVSDDSFGVIMEFSGKCTKAVAEEKVSAMVREAFEIRGMHLKEVKVLAVESTVEKVSCAFAAAALWY